MESTLILLLLLLLPSSMTTLNLQNCPQEAIDFREGLAKDIDGSFEKNVRIEADKAFTTAKDQNTSLDTLYNMYFILDSSMVVELDEHDFPREELPEGLKDLWANPTSGIIKREIKKKGLDFNGDLVDSKEILLLEVLRPPTKTQPTIRLKFLTFNLAPIGTKLIPGLNASHLTSLKFVSGVRQGTKYLQTLFTFDEEGTKIMKEATERNQQKSLSIFMNHRLFAKPIVREPILDGRIRMDSNGDYGTDSIEEDLTKAVQICTLK